MTEPEENTIEWHILKIYDKNKKIDQEIADLQAKIKNLDDFLAEEIPALHEKMEFSRCPICDTWHTKEHFDTIMKEKEKAIFEARKELENEKE